MHQALKVRLLISKSKLECKLVIESMKMVIRLGMIVCHVLLVFPFYLTHEKKHKLEKLPAFLLLLWLSTFIHVKAANDSLKPGDTLNSSSELSSKNNKFSLGFGLLEDQESRYLTINYDDMDIVLRSDRNQLAVGLDDSAVLSLNHSGVLKIESQQIKPIILYSPPQPINNTIATLLDTGNFVLQQFHPNGSKSLLWQSFDYPSDTLLPTMKLGVNRKTGHHWLLRSLPKNLVVASAFSLEWEPMEKELMIRRRGKVCWRSGKLRKNRFEHISEDAQRMLKYSIVSNGDEDSFSFTTNEENKFWFIQDDGQLADEKGDFVRADLCFGYNNTDGGCQTWMNIPKCRNPGDVFQSKFGYAKWDNATLETNTTYVLSDCEASCWSNCNCTGFQAYDPKNGTGCVFLTTQIYYSDGSGKNIYMLVNKTQHNSTKSKRWIWISIVTVTTLLIICVSISWLTFMKRKNVFQEKKRKGMVMEKPHSTTFNEVFATEDFEDDLRKGNNLKVFSYTSVMAATNMFSSGNKLGQGGFGPVYKGILPSGEEIAVKRLSKYSSQGIVEFKNELTLICELQHTNLVQLLGCCIHEEERILIYEYMPNKSLDFYLFVVTCLQNMQWKVFSLQNQMSTALEYYYLKSLVEEKTQAFMMLTAH
ncbi:hypothetical protein Fmac_025164 [Flemingia macrophylla]|uniref:Non-specific serine/threonine protein kinase n=1 Tax=Flemingia macrophylla TaxID=520843 RepID=A0ABD1LRL0_9FABA